MLDEIQEIFACFGSNKVNDHVRWIQNEDKTRTINSYMHTHTRARARVHTHTHTHVYASSKESLFFIGF